MTSIGELAFYNCSGLTSVNIHSNDIASKSYDSSSTLAGIFGSQVTEYVFGNNVHTIGQYACYNCTNLTSITIPESVTSIGRDAFEGTAWYNNQPDGLIYAGKVAYKYKGTMPAGTEIILRDGTLVVADYAFYGCSGLTSVTIPECVTSIGDYAFDCSNLTTVIVKWRTPLAISSNAFSNRMNATLGIPQGTLTAYKLATYWQDFKEFIEIGTPISSITLNREALILYNIGECEQLFVTVEPSNAGSTNMTWRSYNESVCTVTNGLVQATGYGMTVVTATADDGIHMAVCTVMVKQGIPGDLNRDGKLGLIDLQILTQILVGREKNYNFYNADVNEDGRLSLADLTQLVNLLQ